MVVFGVIHNVLSKLWPRDDGSACFPSRSAVAGDDDYTLTSSCHSPETSNW
jgi:hypothetical protein